MAEPDETALVGCLLGTAVGDALGLPWEGLSAGRQRRMCPEVRGHRFFFNRGMVSDDTEHACMTAQAVLDARGDVSAFARALGRRLRWWLLGAPAGVGLATLRAAVKLWLGFPPARSGVYSAGNGPAMRAPLLGVCFGGDAVRLREWVRASTRLTHTDPKAEYGAFAVALAAWVSATGRGGPVVPADFERRLASALRGEAEEFRVLVARAARSASAGRPTSDFAAELGLGDGVSGYVFHTVPVVLHAWFRHADDYRAAVAEVVRCGGDTDTTAAILGGVVGARVGKEGIPAEWLGGLMEWPRTVAWTERLAGDVAAALGRGDWRPAPRLPVPGVLARNLFFLLAVLGHGFRRLLPPY